MNRAQDMDSISSAINTATNAADACRQIWQLCEIWSDAPKEISPLRDELAQANEFFTMIQLAVMKQTWPRTADWVGQLTYELEECFHKAETATRQLRAGIDVLLHVSMAYGVDIGNKRRRALWLRRHDEIGKLRKYLKDAMFEICSIMALLDQPGFSLAEDSVQNMQHAVGAQEQASFSTVAAITGKEQTSNESRDIIPSHRNEGAVLRRSISTFPKAERNDPDRRKSRWMEHKRLGARSALVPGFELGSSCPDDCICACHSMKNWSKSILYFPFLGTLKVSHSGLLPDRTPCSNPRCQSHQSQEKLVRMDIYPSAWLLRASISIFLSFGLSSPELLLRVNKVTELTDVHSYMNQLLWSLQRDEAEGVKYFLRRRLVRSDDIYGPPDRAFTPLRFALDRRSGEMARLLYQSGDFHKTLPPAVASSVLLWLEQDPTATNFLTQTFPLSTTIDEADYNTLHQLIIGLRHDHHHLDLSDYIRRHHSDALAMVNQPNAHGRTPLHVAALRGNAKAVLALLDAGAERDARGTLQKHALHYACKAGSIAVVDALLARGASLHVRDCYGRTPLFDAVGYGSNTNPNLVTHLLTLGIVQDPDDWEKATLLALSCKRGAAVERLLPYWPPAHQLPLYTAIHIGYLDGVRLLLAHGADYRTIDSFGEGILHWLAGSGLEMLRLFKGIGIGIGRGDVDVERRDNRGKTAMEILEGRWDLTEEFRREFVELVDGMKEEEGEGLEGSDGLAEEEEEGAEMSTHKVEDLHKSEGDDFSEDEFFDAPDDLTTNFTPVSEKKEVGSSKTDPLQSHLKSYQSTEPSSLSLEPLSSTPSEQHDLQHAVHENTTHDGEILSDKVGTESDCDVKIARIGDEKSDRRALDRADGLVHGSDAGQEESRRPTGEEPDIDKVLTKEAGLKFRGTSTALRSR